MCKVFMASCISMALYGVIEGGWTVQRLALAIVSDGRYRDEPEWCRTKTEKAVENIVTRIC